VSTEGDYGPELVFQSPPLKAIGFDLDVVLVFLLLVATLRISRAPGENTTAW
jgi:hypothetical protein